ncbi:MAG: hypothetical protein V3V14_13885 [Saprospiraceae bacterium]
MEDRLNRKEEKIKDIGQQFTVNVDTDALWAALEPELPGDKKRRGAAWYVMGAIGILFLGMLSWNMFSESEINLEKTIEDKIVQLDTPKQNIERQNTTVGITNKSNNKTGEKKDIKNNLKSQTSNLETENSSISNLLNTADQTATSVNWKSSKTEKANTFFQKTKSEPKSQTNDIKSNIHPIKTENHTIELINIAQKSFVLDRKREDFYPKINLHNPSIWYSFLTIKSGINLSKNQYSKDFGEIENILINHETPLLGATTSIWYGKQNNGGWKYQLGMTHMVLNTRYSNTDKDVTQDILSQNGTIKINSDGSQTNLGGSLIQTTIVNNDIVWHNTHNYVDVNIQIGKQLITFSNISLSIDASLGYNIWSNHKGYYVDQNNIFTKFKTSEYSPYTKRGLTSGLSMEIGYNMGNLILGLSPFISTTHQYNSNSSYLYKTKNSHYGIQLFASFML